MSNFKISEILCKTIINKSNIGGIDYCINPYTGCSHGCVYCYARFMNKYSKHQEEWGKYVDIKINTIDILKKQITKLSKGLVSLSTVTDPYQEVEKKYTLTRQILEILSLNDFQVSILTKSDLVTRDIDILKKFKNKNCEVGFSIFTLNETDKRYFESGSPSISNRISALKQLHEAGIKTFIFIAPILPYISKNTIFELLEEVKNYTNYIMIDKLNIKYGNWQNILNVLKKQYPDLIEKWKEVLFNKQDAKKYYHRNNKQVIEYAKKNNLQLVFC